MVAMTSNDVDWDKLREVFPDIPKECTYVCIELAINDVVKITADFYSGRDESQDAP